MYLYNENIQRRRSMLIIVIGIAFNVLGWEYQLDASTESVSMEF